MDRPALYFDLASPYAYLAVARATAVLGVEPEPRPVLVGAIFRLRGRGSWAHTAEREQNVAEIERRAARYGLPPLAWPPDWPADSLQAMRAATWATARGAGWPFARAAYRRAFAAGEDLRELPVLVAAAEDAGLPGDELAVAIADPAIKGALREATDAAWRYGVTGVPSLRAGSRVLFGDDRLEEAAQSRA